MLNNRFYLRLLYQVLQVSIFFFLFFTTKMRKPCCKKKDLLVKGAWSKQEDQRLTDYIKIHGEGNWGMLPKAAGLLRCGKSCRLRWINYLRPDIKRGNFAEDEDDLIIKLHALLGNRWSLIAGRLPGRTDNEVKNYWNSHLKKKLISKGVDPKQHGHKELLIHPQPLIKIHDCKVSKLPDLNLRLGLANYGEEDLEVSSFPAPLLL